MIALNEIRDDLTLTAAWCDLVHPAVRGQSVYGHVFLLRSGRTTVTPMVELQAPNPVTSLAANALARECLELIGYRPVTYASFPDRIEATMLKVGPRSHHDRAAALRFFNAFGMSP